MSVKSLGFIETIGMAAAIEAADTALKSANVELIGYELTNGHGMVTIKIQGDVSAVKSALDAAKYSAAKINKVCSTLLIPRPSDKVYSMIKGKKTPNVIKENGEVIEEVDNIIQPLKEYDLDLKKEENIDSKEQVPKSEEVTSSDLGDNSDLLNEDEKNENQICNICHDPLCTRKKGQSRNLCIHYNNE